MAVPARISGVKAYIDESGQRSKSSRSSDHFVMSAVMLEEGELNQASDLLARIRAELGRQPGDHLTWKNIKSHQQRVRAAQMVGSATFLTITSVIVCKRDFDAGKGSIPSDDFAYMYTFRFLLERMSWFARDTGGTTIDYVLAQIGRFRLAQLREYERNLRALADARVHWPALPRGGQIDQPRRLEYLQFADIAASATAQAFESDQFGNTEQRYLEELRPRLYVYPGGRITSYGLKMHPWNDKSRGAHPWLTQW